MKVTPTPIVIEAFTTVTKGLVQRLGDLETRGRLKIIQSKASLKSVRILRRVLETWGDLLSLKPLSEEPLAFASVKKISQKKKTISKNERKIKER